MSAPYMRVIDAQDRLIAALQIETDDRVIERVEDALAAARRDLVLARRVAGRRTGAVVELAEVVEETVGDLLTRATKQRLVARLAAVAPSRPVEVPCEGAAR